MKHHFIKTLLTLTICTVIGLSPTPARAAACTAANTSCIPQRLACQLPIGSCGSQVSAGSCAGSPMCSQVLDLDALRSLCSGLGIDCSSLSSRSCNSTSTKTAADTAVTAFTDTAAKATDLAAADDTAAAKDTAASDTKASTANAEGQALSDYSTAVTAVVSAGKAESTTDKTSVDSTASTCNTAVNSAAAPSSGNGAAQRTGTPANRSTSGGSANNASIDNGDSSNNASCYGNNNAGSNNASCYGNASTGSNNASCYGNASTGSNNASRYGNASTGSNNASCYGNNNAGSNNTSCYGNNNAGSSNAGCGSTGKVIVKQITSAADLEKLIEQYSSGCGAYGNTQTTGQDTQKTGSDAAAPSDKPAAGAPVGNTKTNTDTTSQPDTATDGKNTKPGTSAPSTGSTTSKNTDTKPDTSAQTNSGTQTTTTAGSSEYVNRIVELVNQERAKQGLSPVTLDTKITQAAQIRASEIITSFSHTRPNGSSFSTVLKENGISYSGCGENIAWGQKSPEAVMEAWMNSEGHRANILNKNYKYIGVGYVQSSNGTKYWSQLFTY